jgi:hypothetical protein
MHPASFVRHDHINSLCAPKYHRNATKRIGARGKRQAMHQWAARIVRGFCALILRWNK